MAARWEAVSASARGALHDRRGLPNQDAVATRVLAPASTMVVAAVADGHGGESYVRSDTGAQMAVRTACDIAAELLSPTPPNAEELESALRFLPERIVARWREQVDAHIGSTPFTAEERLRGGADVDDDPRIAYGATLLLAIASDTSVVLFQLGDGDIILATTDGQVLVPVPSDDRLVGGQTTSLCLPTAADDFRTVTVPTGTDLVVMASDGYGNSFADPSWRENVVRDLRDRIQRDGLARLGEDLPAWLQESAVAAGDDVTVAVLVRTGSSDGPIAAPGPHAGERRRSPETPHDPASHTKPVIGPGLVIGIAIAAVVLGGVTGWLLGHSRESSKPSDRGSGTGPLAKAATDPPSSTLAPQSQSDVTAPSPAGGTIAFRSNPADPAAQHLTSAAPGVAVTRLELNGATWQIEPTGVTVRRSGRTISVPGTSIRPASLFYAGGFVWVFDAQGAHLAAIDVDTTRFTADGVKRVQEAGESAVGSSRGG